MLTLSLPPCMYPSRIPDSDRDERQSPVDTGVFDGLKLAADVDGTHTTQLQTLLARLNARHVELWLEESTGRVRVKGLATLTADEQSQLRALSEPIRVYLEALTATVDLDAQPPSTSQDASTDDEAARLQATAADATSGKSRGRDRRIFRPPTPAVPPPWCSNLPPSITGADDGGAILL